MSKIELTNEKTLKKILDKWQAASKVSVPRVEKDLNRLSELGMNIKVAREALQDFAVIDGRDYDYYEYENEDVWKEDREDAWEAFLNALEEIEEEESA